MKLLVTGGAGFIGSAVVRRAIASGDQVLNLDAMTYAASPDTLKDIEAQPNYQFVKGSIGDAALLAGIFDGFEPDAVMNLAAESHVDRSIDAPATFVETNIVGSFVLLQAARAYWEKRGKPAGFRFHHVSTDEVFGSLGRTGSFDEETSYQPRSPYSASKAASDHLVRAWEETYGLPVILTNCSNNYGPFQFPEKLIPKTILSCLMQEPILVYAKGENVRDWLYVGDHAEALLTVIRQANAGASYAIGGRAEARNIDIVHGVCSIMDGLRPARIPHDRLIEFVADRPGHDFRYAINPAKIEAELGWRAGTALSDGLQKTVEWYLVNEDWWRPLIDRAGGRLGTVR